MENEELKVITKIYDLIQWTIPQIMKFPRIYRFTIGEKIESLLLEILEFLIKAKYSKDKKEILRETNIKIEILRFYIRLSKDLHFINIKRYEYLSKQLNEIGNLVGGWLKQQEKKGDRLKCAPWDSRGLVEQQQYEELTGFQSEQEQTGEQEQQ